MPGRCALQLPLSHLAALQYQSERAKEFPHYMQVVSHDLLEWKHDCKPYSMYFCRLERNLDVLVYVDTE